jgi:hypothetical protein
MPLNSFFLSSWNFPGPKELQSLQQLKTEASMVAKTVLVVEDDPSIRIVAEEMFVAAGFEVESVQRADHALDIVAQRSEQTAFLFTDVKTPGRIDGIAGENTLASCRSPGHIGQTCFEHRSPRWSAIYFKAVVAQGRS